MSSLYATEVSLGRLVFGQTDLEDKRRTERLVQTFDQLCRHPGGTLPDKLASPAGLKGFYRFCDCETVTHAKLIESLRAHTLERLTNHEGPVLVLHDATELDYTTLTSLADELGQIGKGTHRGYICQNVLAVDAQTGEVFGLLDQILHRRARVEKKETLEEHRARESRESLLWLKGTQHLPATKQLIDVADQGASTFEFLEHETHSGRRFVIRNSKIRKVYAGHVAEGPKYKLEEYLRSLPELGRFTMDVQAQRDRAARKGGEFAVRGGAVLVLPPHAKWGNHGDQPLPLYGVLVVEVEPPRGQEAIEWMLLTNEPVQTLADAQRVIGWYERRWIIEEYHKGLKTGCGIEDMQFTSTSRLDPAIALLSGVALSLLNLRDMSRQPEAQTRPATTLFAREYVEVLSSWRQGKIRVEFTVREFFYALARLGGHQNRCGDHRPGWLILWRGWMKLQLLVDGYLASQRNKCG